MKLSTVGTPLLPWWKRKLRVALAIYLFLWALTAFVSAPMLERERLVLLRDVSPEYLQDAQRQIVDRQAMEHGVRADLALSDDPDDVARLQQLGPVPDVASRYPTYWAKTFSLAPFVIVVNEGRVLAPLCGHGSRQVYLQLLGLSVRVLRLRYWVA